MISRLAKETVARWKREGLEPTFEDVVRLNALGLKVERGGSSYEFGAVPRMAFLGDCVFREPTVAKRIWLECAMRLLKDDYSNQLFLTAYALNAPSRELPPLNDVDKVVKEVTRFRDEVLLGYTETQIMACVEYALRGDDPTLDEDAEPTGGTNGNDDRDVEDVEDVKDGNDVSDLPESALSATRQVLMEALSYGIDGDVKHEVTLPELERLVMLAAMHSGVDVLKGEHGQAVGAFYAACGRIHERLMTEQGHDTQEK